VGIRESATAHVDAAAGPVFDLVTSVPRLPEWNPGITEVLDTPPHLVPGSVWRVRIRALGQSWVSRSEVVTLDPAAGHFAYRSQSDDGNPSFADWDWHVEPEGSGTRVTVTVELEPLTFWRKHVLVRLRRPALRGEMRRSVAALGPAVRE
jgi:Polyketide cyclase / dehydrase and lipid transport